MLRAVPDLRELGRLALDLGIDAVRAGQSLTVFAITTPPDEEPALRWFVDATGEAAVVRARHAIATSDAGRYAIGFEEEIRDREGKKRSAIVVEVGDRDHETALRMAQPYVPFLAPGRPLQRLGNPMMLGDTTNVLRGATLDPGRAPSFVVVCPACSKKNRVSLERVRSRLPKCGSCSKELVS